MNPIDYDRPPLVMDEITKPKGDLASARTALVAEIAAELRAEAASYERPGLSRLLEGVREGLLDAAAIVEHRFAAPAGSGEEGGR